MSVKLYDHELLLLLHATPLGLEPASEEEGGALRGLAKRGLLRRSPLGPFFPTRRARALLSSNLGGDTAKRG